MRILVLCDDNWHPADVVRQGLEPLRANGLDFHYVLENDFEFQTDLAQTLRDYPVLIIAKSNRVSADKAEPWITEQTEHVLQHYVNEGGGLLVLHSGTVGYKESVGMRALVGAVFTHHPEQCPVTVNPAAENLITEGVQAFTIKDEHYFVEMTEPGDAQVFLVTTSEHGAQPGGWTRMQGKGRVCVLTPGHNLEVWLQPEYQNLLKQALVWTASVREGE